MTKDNNQVTILQITGPAFPTFTHIHPRQKDDEKKKIFNSIFHFFTYICSPNDTLDIDKGDHKCITCNFNVIQLHKP